MKYIFKEHVDIGTTVAAQTYMSACCVFQIASQKTASDIREYPEYISNSPSFAEFSIINKFPEISTFSRVVSTL